MEKTISNNDFNELLQKENLAVIDVREADEFAAGHIPNAKN
ncbi:rhodanese-like domain-containing protein, partial [Enterococcus sp.]